MAVSLSACTNLGGKKMDETKMIDQERKAALQIKGMFKDVKEVKISEPDVNPLRGGVDFGVKVTLTNGEKDNLGITLGDKSGYINGEKLEEGITNSLVRVVYSNNEEETL